MGENDAHPLTEDQLDALVDELQDRLGDSTARTYGRRGVLAALGVAALGTGSASAQASGTVGTASNPVDVEGYDISASNSFTDPAGVTHSGELADLSDVGASGQWQEVNSGANIEPIDGETIGTGSETADLDTLSTDEENNTVYAEPGEVQSKIDTVAASVSSVERGIVKLLPDTQYQLSNVRVKEFVTLDQNGSLITNDGDNDIIELSVDARLKDPNIDVFGGPFSSAAVVIDDLFAGEVMGEFGETGIVGSGHIEAASTGGSAVKIASNGGYGVYAVHTGYLTIAGFKNGFHLNSASAGGYVNGNIINGFVGSCTNHILIEGTSAPGANRGHVDHQPTGPSEKLCYIKNGNDNTFSGMTWDVANLTDTALVVDSGTGNALWTPHRWQEGQVTDNTSNSSYDDQNIIVSMSGNLSVANAESSIEFQHGSDEMHVVVGGKRILSIRDDRSIKVPAQDLSATSSKGFADENALYHHDGSSSISTPSGSTSKSGLYGWDGSDYVPLIQQ